MLKAFFLALALLPAGPQDGTARNSRCADVPACIAALRSDVRDGRQVVEPVRLRLAELGEPAVEALVPLLTDADRGVRESAGLALTYFPRIDSRHLPALVRAWRESDTGSVGRGNGWLPRPIAATGTDEALRLLWQDFERDPDQGSNSQTFFALAWGMGERVRPLLLGRIAACRDSADGSPCAGIYTLLGEFRPRIPAWSVAAILDLAEHARSDAVRVAAENMLASLSHPAALAPLQRRLAVLRPDAAIEGGRWRAASLIRQIARYGAAARASGPAIMLYLGAAQDEDLRADAALALGRIDSRAAVPALLALAPALPDDWLLAYNVAESLGRLRAEAARSLLERLAREHWHRGVRRNAARALSALSGGPFAIPAEPGSGVLYPNPRSVDGQEFVYIGDLRFAGDDATRACPRLARMPGVVAGAEAGEALRRRIPNALARGEVKFVLQVNRGALVGLDGGEFGGGIVLLRDRGSPRALTDEPVAFAWRMGRRLYVAAGLAHLGLDRGHLYVVDLARLRIQRTIRLPASPRALHAAPGGAAVIDTAAGQVAVGPDGRLIDSGRIDGCAAP